MKSTLTLALICFVSLLKAQPCISNSNSLLFDGTSAYVDLAPAVSIDTLTGPLTVEAWILASSWGFNRAQNTILCTHGWTTGEQGFVLRAGGSGELSFNFAGLDMSSLPVSWVEVISPLNTLQLNAWTHVAGTFSGTELKIFVNGAEVGSTLFSGSMIPSSYGAKLGKLADNSQFPGRHFEGNIDEVRIWNRALSDNELIASAYSHPDPLTSVGLVGYWRFNDGVGSVASDLSSGLNNGLLVNANWSVSVPFNEIPPAPIISWNGTELTSSFAQNNQWNLYDTAIAGANSQNYVPVQNGIYTVTYTAANGCTVTSLAFMLTTVGLNSPESGSQLRVWPNPANHQIYIQNNFLQGSNSHIYIYDIRQRLVLQSVFDNNSRDQVLNLDISTLDPGMYRVEVMSKGAGKNTRLIVQ